MEENREKSYSNGNLKARKYVNYILGIIEVLLAMRFVFKLLGANPGNPFVSFTYSLTQIGLAPFTTIFSTASTKGLEAKAVLEPATIIAMIVYAIIAWGIIKLIEINKKTNDTQKY
jgi:hypothetical protein